MYSQQDIKDNLSNDSYSKGLDYYKNGKVLAFKYDEASSSIDGTISGSKNQVYEVNVKIFKNAGHVTLIGSCTCPVSIDCKHAAALLIAALGADNSNAQNNEKPQLGLAVSDPGIISWIDKLQKSASKKKAAYKPKKLICYIVLIESDIVSVHPVSVELKKNGEFGKIKELDKYAGRRSASYISFKDRVFLQILGDLAQWVVDSYQCTISGEDGSKLLKEIVDTGRCYFQDINSPPLSFAEEREATLRWTSLPDGSQKMVCDAQGMHIMVLNPLWYIDDTTHTCGYLNVDAPSDLAEVLLKAPKIPPQEIRAVHTQLSSIGLPEAIAMPKVFSHEKLVKALPTPELTLYGHTVKQYMYGYGGDPITLGLAKISYNYDGISIPYNSMQPTLSKIEGDSIIYLNRNTLEEKKLLALFQNAGPFVSPRHISSIYNIPRDIANDFTICKITDYKKGASVCEDEWLSFMEGQVNKLRNNGWTIRIESSFPYNILKLDSDWEAKIDESSGIDWFSLSIGITVDGQPVDLVPILLKILKTTPDIFDILDTATSEILLVNISPETRMALPINRVNKILTFLRDLYGASGIGEDGRLRLSQFEAANLKELELATQALGIRWFGGERVKRLGEKLKTFEGITAVDLPSSLNAELRPYQMEGLNWLQFLREYELAGILADDMGLGKTIQTLANIMVEKEQGRLNAPALVIAPTSVIANWHIEIKKFAPKLKTLLLHGIGRKQLFADIGNHDVVLTTYALLPRDKDSLLKQTFHIIILDEAQYIKNPKAQLTQVVNQLKATHRVCLTGTPLENHLGELWSLFNFLVPGLLGTLPEFNKFYRNPIEKNGDNDTRLRLVRRIKPFILRRTKDKVATELPAKTEIVQVSTLSKQQADLYETIRVSMNAKIQKEIETKGLARSHIVILDALLKLRQVCCHPKLLKSTVAKNINESSKLEQLMGMLNPLLEEGRKVIIFSQFVSMLELIEEKLFASEIKFAKLTGQTKDRYSQITKFQTGEVSVFLISLKAGGTGINLTAADTVIHYDPWWNPAAENQATDRAHRIGQDKPVFVYKMIAANTIEEKIMEMQKRKAVLAEGIFDPDSKAAAKLSVEDINALFAAS